MGLDIYLEFEGQTEVQDWTEADWRAWHLRSSYNPGGFNSWADRHLGGTDLYYIFQPEDEYTFTPDWDACLLRAREVLELAERVVGEPWTIACSPIDVYASLYEAMAVFKQERKETFEMKHALRCYSSRKGDFFFENPPKVIGVMLAKNILGRTSVVLFCEDEGYHQQYINYIRERIIPFIEEGKRREAKVVWSE